MVVYLYLYCIILYVYFILLCMVLVLVYLFFASSILLGSDRGLVEKWLARVRTCLLEHNVHARSFKRNGQ